MSAFPIPAVIVGFETNGLGVARALRQERIPSISLSAPGWSPSHASWATEVVSAHEWTEDAVVSALLAIGERLPGKAPMLITKDEAVLWISANRDALAERFVITMPDPDTVSLLMSKTRFQALAAERGWPLPLTWLAQSRSEIAALASGITYPCILKPAVKNSSFRQHSPAKAYKIETSKELLETYDTVSAWEPEVILQEWVGGGDDRIAFGLGYWNARSQNLALFAGRKLRQWPPECGNTALSEPAPNEWRAEMIALTTRVFEAVGYRGLGSLEFKRSPAGRLVIMEPTVGRTNYQNEIAVLNGVNLPAIAYYDGIGAPQPLERLTIAARHTHRATKLVDTPADYRSARFYMSRSELTWRGWLGSRGGRTRDVLFRYDDPLPGLASTSRAIASFIKHRVLKPVLRPLIRRR